MHNKQQQNSPLQPSLLDQIVAARDDAIDRVEKHADVDWKIKAYQTGVDIARREEFLVSEDIWQALVDQGVHTHEPRAMGAVMRKLRAANVIAPTERFIISPSPLGHGRPSRVWESLIWPGKHRTSESHDRPSAVSDNHIHVWTWRSPEDQGSVYVCRECGASNLGDGS